jgi:hypothetical protein
VIHEFYLHGQQRIVSGLRPEKGKLYHLAIEGNKAKAAGGLWRRPGFTNAVIGDIRQRTSEF